jgi:hypothetical protein
MSTSAGPDIVNDGLVLSIDPASKRCNSASGGTTLTNLALSGTSSSVINGTTSESIVSLDGTNDWIKVNNSVTSQELSPLVATFSIWFKADDTYSSGNTCSLISRGNYNNSGGFFIHMANQSGACRVEAKFSNSTTSSYSYDGTAYYTVNPFGEWNNVIVTVDNNIKLYTNGELRATTVRNASTIIYGNGTINTNSDTNLAFVSSLGYAPTLEQGSGGTWRPFNGDFGGGMMYNRILSASEILQNYNAQKNRFI